MLVNTTLVSMARLQMLYSEWLDQDLVVWIQNNETRQIQYMDLPLHKPMCYPVSYPGCIVLSTLYFKFNLETIEVFQEIVGIFLNSILM